MAGWTILDRLKHDPATRHIPVHVITGDENRRRGLALGAMTYLEKSVTKDNLNVAFDTIHHSLERRTRKLLIVAPEEPRRINWRDALGGARRRNHRGQLGRRGAGRGEAAIPGCHRPRSSASPISRPPTGRGDPGRNQPHAADGGLRPESPAPRRSGHPVPRRQSVVRYAESLERLLEETVLLLHRAETDLSESQREILKALRQNASVLAGKKVLVVDDDVRNIFALTDGSRAARPAGGSRGEWPRGHRNAAQDAWH